MADCNFVGTVYRPKTTKIIHKRAKTSNIKPKSRFQNMNDFDEIARQQAHVQALHNQIKKQSFNQDFLEFPEDVSQK